MNVEIKLDKVRKVRFNARAFAFLQQQFPEAPKPAHEFAGWFFAHFRNLEGGEDDPLNWPPWDIAIAFLWACLKLDDRSLTVEQVEDLLTTNNFSEAVIVCLTAYSQFAERSKLPLAGNSVGESSADSVATVSN